MPNMSAMRASCYLILQGLERSVAENIINGLATDIPNFLLPQEARLALDRLREDMQDAWGVDDVSTIDLLEYLDLGALVGLLNRNRSKMRNATETDVRHAAQIIERHSVYAIRNRVMHPVRPLESDDLSILMTTAEQLRTDASSLTWEPLDESLRLVSDTAAVANVTIPPYWIDEPRIVNNLPVPEFEETGFIGRREERKGLKNLLQSGHNVVTVVGAGGIGKTALALQVCYDFLDDPSSDFDSIVWVSLKTHRLTVDGIQEIAVAVDAMDRLMNDFASATGTSNQSGPITWDIVLDQMRASRVLLVIDNLETLGSGIRDLAVGMPQQSKLLLTSRVGLGEIELRYPISALSSKDSSQLMRHLGIAYSYSAIKTLDPIVLATYCERLHHNPLLIKWFVQAVGKGVRPQDVLAHQDFDEALKFCFDNVYSGLSEFATDIIATLRAARQSLSQAQIREITGIDRIPFEEALLELRQSNIIEIRNENTGSGSYQIGGLVLDYLSRHNPPSNQVVAATRDLIRKWRIEQDQSANRRNAYRYSRGYIHVETEDQRISAPYLRSALKAAHQNDLAQAETSLKHALELTPDWSEAHRAHARLLEVQNRPIYEIEDAHENAIRCSDNDISRRHYAVYLMSIHEHDRALEQIELALGHPDGLQPVLRGLKGVSLMRLGRVAEALVEHEAVWADKESNLSRFDRIIQGTQLAETLRRYVEQLVARGMIQEAAHALSKGISVTKQAAEECNWDSKLAEVGVRLLSEGMAVPGLSDAMEISLVDTAKQWDSDAIFVQTCTSYKAYAQFGKDGVLAQIMPRASRSDQSSSDGQRLSGKVLKLMGAFGFIELQSTGTAHINPSSLIEPSGWANLKVGQEVTCEIITNTKGLHAVRLEFIYP